MSDTESNSENMEREGDHEGKEDLEEQKDYNEYDSYDFEGYQGEDEKEEEKEEEDVKEENEEKEYSLERYKGWFRYWCNMADFQRRFGSTDEEVREYLKGGGIMNVDIDWFFSRIELLRELRNPLSSSCRDFDFSEGRIFDTNWKYVRREEGDPYRGGDYEEN
jgi:hypothetical protein